MIWYLWPPCVVDADIIFLSCFFFFYSLPNLSSRRMDVYRTSTHDTWCSPSANLECRSEMCCTRLAGNAGPKKKPSGLHSRTLSGKSSQLRHISTIGKKLVKQQYLLEMSPQYGELRPASGWDWFGSLGHPCKFQRVSRFGNVTALHCSSGRQPNFGRRTKGATYIWQGGHDVGHWPTYF